MSQRLHVVVVLCEGVVGVVGVVCHNGCGGWLVVVLGVVVAVVCARGGVVCGGGGGGGVDCRDEVVVVVGCRITVVALVTLLSMGTYSRCSWWW